jgi:hypothetical protein
VETSTTATLFSDGSNMNFGSVEIAKSNILKARLTNTGNETLKPAISITPVGAPYTLSPEKPCSEVKPGAECEFRVAFNPVLQGDQAATLTVKGNIAKDLTLSLTGTGTRSGCWAAPTRYDCMDFGDGVRTNILNFFSVSKPLSYFTQIKSVYNGASSAATVSADIAELYFLSGFEVDAGTNIQAGATTPTAVSTGTVPTLSATNAALAAQNMLYGGTIYASASYPLLAFGTSGSAKAGNFGLRADLVGREGIDIQSFKSGTSTTAAAPPSHTSVQLQGYAQYNSINLTTDSSTYLGAIFVGFAYGYDYMSHGYQRDYGFADVNNGVGQLSAGVLINGVAKIALSRGVGPSQTYIDSTTSKQTSTNSFKSWSFGITYQSSSK